MKLCTLAARPFQLHLNGALIRMQKWCQVQASQNERAIGAVHCKKEGMLLQPFGWRCIESVIHHKRDQRKEQRTNICDTSKQ